MIHCIWTVVLYVVIGALRTHGTVSSGYIHLCGVWFSVFATLERSLPTTGVWRDISMLHVNPQTVLSCLFLNLTSSQSVPFTQQLWACVSLWVGVPTVLFRGWGGGAFCINGALQHLRWGGGDSIYVNGLPGLIVCWAVQRLFFMKTSWRKGKLVWAPHQTHTHTQTNPYTHTQACRQAEN